MTVQDFFFSLWSLRLVKKSAHTAGLRFDHLEISISFLSRYDKISGKIIMNESSDLRIASCPYLPVHHTGGCVGAFYYEFQLHDLQFKFLKIIINNIVGWGLVKRRFLKRKKFVRPISFIRFRKPHPFIQPKTWVTLSTSPSFTAIFYYVGGGCHYRERLCWWYLYIRLIENRIFSFGPKKNILENTLWNVLMKPTPKTFSSRSFS